MVDFHMQTPAQSPADNGRRKARAARLKLVRDNQTPPPVSVYAASAEIHAVVRHPNGVRFRGDFGTPTEWPHDAFTHRRIVEGTVLLKAPSGEQPKPDPSMGVRDAARARRPKPEDVPPMQPVSEAPVPVSEAATTTPAPTAQ